MENSKKKILIVGNSIATVALVKKLHNDELDIFVVGMPMGMPEYVHFVDIREEKVTELLEFVLANAIDFTICTSNQAIKADIAGIFNANGQMIFAPDAESAIQFIDEALTKKFLYKLRIPTSKFGIFDKPQLAQDYLKTANFPLIIKSSEALDERDMFACPTPSVASIALNDLFLRSTQKVLIKEFKNGHNFNFYVITDGYKALPLGILTSHKFSDAVCGGFLTKGSASLLPDFKVSAEIQDYIMKNVVTRICGALETAGTPYLGILGIHCIMQDDSILVEKITPFVEDVDAQILFASIQDDLLSIFQACAMGVFADDYDFIRTNDNSAVAISLFARLEGAEINGLELLDEPENLCLSTTIKHGEFRTRKGIIGVLSASAKTLARAKANLQSELSSINYEGMKWRKDILQNNI